jgi:lambda family phage minor tail protein L
MTLLADIQKFDQDATIELFVLDGTSRGWSLVYFHSGTNEFKGNIVWQGQTYQMIPIEADGFELSGDKFPRPKLRVANIQGIFSSIVNSYYDLIGAKIIRKRTTARYLDAANFVGGNPNANPAEHYPDDIFYIRRKTNENQLLIEFELGSSLDLSGVMLPQGVVLANTCRFKYRGEGCQYSGGPVANSNDGPTSNPALDDCSRTVKGCKLRFGANGELPFGGYPGSALLAF